MKNGESQSLWSCAFEHAPIGMAVIALDGRWLEVNQSLSSMFGLSVPELKQLRIADVFHPDDRPIFGSFERDCESLPNRIHSRFWRRDHGIGYATVYPTLMPRSGRQANTILLYIEDVTEQKKAEASLMLSDRMVTLGTIASGVAHEINNPLAYVTANLELIAGQLRAESEQRTLNSNTSSPLKEVEELVHEARQGAERVRRIVRELKTFSRVDEERRSPLELTRVLDLSANMVFNEVRHRARIVKDYGPIPIVHADESRLAQVFVNLMINASQALPEGQAHRHEIRLVTRANSAGGAVVEISDTGCGIAENIRDRIFDPFFTTKPAGVGTGLGLAICRDIVQKLGGTISVSSTVGHGSTFRVHVPVGDLPARKRETIPPAVESGRRGRILVVDDEPLLTRTIHRVLGQDHVVTEVESGIDALSRIEQGERYDVILCDLMMPEMTGMDLHARLSVDEPSQAERMLFLTGGAFSPRARQFLDQISNQWIEKPFDSNNLRAIVRNLVK